MVKIGAYVISEFGPLIIQDGKTYKDQFSLLDAHFYNVSNATKAQLITSYMKMLKNCPELKSQVVTILSQYSDHWDEELQQRACEYQRMLDRADEDANAKQLVMNSLDKMPNFSEDLQTNNVLTRRILALKVKKGFAIN